MSKKLRFEEVPEEVHAYQALSSLTRKRILDLLTREGPINIDEIAKRIDLKEITVRHHIKMLEGVGLIESFEGARSTPGRPMQYYRIADRPPALEFPKRQYERLAGLLLENAVSKQGKDDVVQEMQRMGKHLAEEMMNDLKTRYSIEKWNLENFCKFVVPELDRLGSYPKVAKTDNELTLKITNCIFLEVARRFRGVVCEAHKAFFQTIAGVLGDFVARQETCMAEGDDSCVTIITRTKGRRAGKAGRSEQNCAETPTV